MATNPIMNIASVPYHDERDLEKIQQATAAWIAIAGFEGRINVSDIAWRLFNGMRQYDPREIVRLWQATDGQLLGWGMVYPSWNGYEVQVHPDYRLDKLEIDIVNWAESEIIRWIQKLQPDNTKIQQDVFGGDKQRQTLLEGRGYSRREKRGIISTRRLDEPIPDPQLPDGFSIRSLAGEHEAPELVALMNDSFGWHWSVEAYQRVMRSPNYEATNELVVVASDGRLAASCIVLPDKHNQTVMFENVGTSPDFRRLGLAKALLLTGMGRMKGQGFSMASVPHSTTLEAAMGLYASVGFRPIYDIYTYSRLAT